MDIRKIDEYFTYHPLKDSAEMHLQAQYYTIVSNSMRDLAMVFKSGVVNLPFDMPEDFTAQRYALLAVAGLRDVVKRCSHPDNIWMKEFIDIHIDVVLNNLADDRVAEKLVFASLLDLKMWLNQYVTMYFVYSLSDQVKPLTSDIREKMQLTQDVQYDIKARLDPDGDDLWAGYDPLDPKYDPGEDFWNQCDKHSEKLELSDRKQSPDSNVDVSGLNINLGWVHDPRVK